MSLYSADNPPEFLTDDRSLATEVDTPAEQLASTLRRSGRELGALVGLFFVTLVAFVVCVPLFSLGLGTLPIGVGLVVLVGTLAAASGFAGVTRSLLAAAGQELPRPRPANLGDRPLLSRLRDTQSWRELLHVLVAFVLSTASFSVAVSWVAGGLGGVTYGLWERHLPEDRQGLAWLLGFPGRLAEVATNTVLGALLLLTAPAVLHGLVVLHAMVARGLLVDERGALRQQVSSLTESRSAAGDAEVHTLRTLERNLHDGPQQRLVRLGMDISTARRRIDTDAEQAKQLLDEAFSQSQDALTEIRTLSRGIAPPVLAERGLAAAVTALAARGSVPTAVDVADVPLSGAGLNAAYYVVAEALANIEKHSAATAAEVEVRATGGLAVVTVSDDGVGGASLAKGHGLAGLADRLAGLDGQLHVTSPAGGPTVVTATLPLAIPAGTPS